MKKLIYLIVLALILGLVLTGCLLSNVGQVPSTGQSGINYLTKHTEDAPQETTLFAGQTINVGTVSVWNDADYLYVKYELNQGTIDEDWCLTETHLAVVIDEDDFPTNKAGNPKVGHFPYQCSYNGSEWVFQIKEDGNTSAGCDADGLTEACLTAITYTIPLDWGPDIGLFIAAHAVIERTETGTFMPDLAWQRSLEPDDTMFFPGYGAAWTPAEAFTIPLDPVQTVWDNGTYYDNSVPLGREWASWVHVHEGYSDLRRLQAIFTIPDGYTVTGGSLYAPHFTGGIPINDNVYIFVNGSENLLFWGGTRADGIGEFLGMFGIQALRGASDPVETDRWYIPGTIPEVTGFIPDENKIDIFTEENARWGGMGKLVFEFSYEKTYSESAWADGTRFTKPGNWATYFTYIVPLQQIEVLAVGPDPVEIELLSGDYRFVVSGTADAGDTIDFDAKYSITNRIQGDTWTDAISGYTLPPEVLDLFVNNASVNWGGYNEKHIYEYLLAGWTGGAVTFCIYDTYPINNSGYLTVEIYKQ